MYPAGPPKAIYKETVNELMRIFYTIINTLILAAAAYFLGRKMAGKGFVGRFFNERRRRIDKDLDSAAEAFEISEATEGIMAAENSEAENRISAIRDEFEKRAEERAEHILAAGKEENETIKREDDRLFSGLRIEMYETLRKDAIKKAKESALKLMGEEPYVSDFRKKEEEITATIFSKVILTPGDMSYLVKSGVLYVNLTSAFPLNERLRQEIKEKSTALVEKAGGGISFWEKVDASLVGGLRLSIGDTVYDGTISDLLYRMTKTFTKETEGEGFSAASFAERLIAGVSDAKMEISVYQIGRVLSISDGICWLDGLADIMYGEVVEFISTGERGMVLDIGPEKVGCIIFGRYEHIEAGDTVRRVKHMASVPVGESLLGRVVDPLGAPMDGFGTIRAEAYRPIEWKAPAILDRKSVSEPLHTGIKAIDALVPIGRGQRELIIGDKQTGKTAIAIDAILNQKGKDVVCIYVAVGQKDTSVADILAQLKKHGAMEYTVIVCADAFSSASMQYIAPFSGTALGEYFMYKGKDVLIVYDDLSKHAVAYRELSLLLHRPSGREAYPGDVFYLHSRLLERSARLSAEAGGGSMTALPVIETQAGDISTYIPTNVISITDGQIFLETELFNAGQRPAINVGLSVSRVGGAAQRPFMKKIAASLRTNLAQYRELESFAQFGSDLDEATKKVLDSGARIIAALNQPRYAPIRDDKEALMICAVTEGFADKVPPEDIAKFQTALFEHFAVRHPHLLETIRSPKKLTEQDEKAIREALRDFAETF